MQHHLTSADFLILPDEDERSLFGLDLCGWAAQEAAKLLAQSWVDVLSTAAPPTQQIEQMIRADIHDTIDQLHRWEQAVLKLVPSIVASYSDVDEWWLYS